MALFTSPSSSISLSCSFSIYRLFFLLFLQCLSSSSLFHSLLSPLHTTISALIQVFLSTFLSSSLRLQNPYVPLSFTVFFFFYPILLHIFPLTQPLTYLHLFFFYTSFCLSFNSFNSTKASTCLHPFPAPSTSSIFSPIFNLT